MAARRFVANALATKMSPIKVTAPTAVAPEKPWRFCHEGCTT
jgi:hypothetical protein